MNAPNERVSFRDQFAVAQDGDRIVIGTYLCKSWTPIADGILFLNTDNSVRHVGFDGKDRMHLGEHRNDDDEIKVWGQQAFYYRSGAFHLVDFSKPSKAVRVCARKNVSDWTASHNGLYCLDRNGNLEVIPYGDSRPQKVGESGAFKDCRLDPHPKGIIAIKRCDDEKSNFSALIDGHMHKIGEFDWKQTAVNDFGLTVRHESGGLVFYPFNGSRSRTLLKPEETTKLELIGACPYGVVFEHRADGKFKFELIVMK